MMIYNSSCGVFGNYQIGNFFHVSLMFHVVILPVRRQNITSYGIYHNIGILVFHEKELKLRQPFQYMIENRNVYVSLIWNSRNSFQNTELVTTLLPTRELCTGIGSLSDMAGLQGNHCYFCSAKIKTYSCNSSSKHIRPSHIGMK